MSPVLEWPVFARDHPRACGEHVLSASWTRLTRGSSPRLRGTFADLPHAVPDCGIIPALAGNIVGRLTSRLITRDHPRACGEHHTIDTITADAEGSSPRLRGTLRHWDCSSSCSRIIPALAGNIASYWPARLGARDHPRACGEHSVSRITIPSCAGSSPRLRGTLWHDLGHGAAQGIIPALAGNMTEDEPKENEPRDHPRACGEHYYRVPAAIAGQGSSPRLRGTCSWVHRSCTG